MSHIIVLDSGPLGALTNTLATPHSNAVKAWVTARAADGDTIVIPDIADYEVRRELIRAGLTLSIEKLDLLRELMRIVPINSTQMREAATLWGQARNQGKPAAVDHAMDGDMILVAQARAAEHLFPYLGNSVIIATTNPKHLDTFVDARLWSDI